MHRTSCFYALLDTLALLRQEMKKGYTGLKSSLEGGAEPAAWCLTRRDSAQIDFFVAYSAVCRTNTTWKTHLVSTQLCSVSTHNVQGPGRCIRWHAGSICRTNRTIGGLMVILEETMLFLFIISFRLLIASEICVRTGEDIRLHNACLSLCCIYLKWRRTNSHALDLFTSLALD